MRRYLPFLVLAACTTDVLPLEAKEHCTTFNGLLVPVGALVAAEIGCNVCSCNPSNEGPLIACTAGACEYTYDPTFVPPANNPDFPWCTSQEQCVLEDAATGTTREGKCLFDPGCDQRGRCIFTAHCEPRYEAPVPAAEGWCGCDGQAYSGCPIAPWTGGSSPCE